MRRSQVTHERLLDVLRYDPVSGNFYWRVATSNKSRIKAGAIAGRTKPDGYVTIKIDGVSYYAHRLARFYVIGEWPANGVDHKHGVEAGNGWNNLRDATSGQNNRNRKLLTSSWSGLKGASKYRGRWRARICTNGRRQYLGSFASPEAAHAAYVAAGAVLHGEFARTA